MEPEIADVKVKMSRELMEIWSSRTDRGDLVTFDWGEPDAEGFHTPTITINGADNIVATVLRRLESAVANLKAPVLGKKGVLLKDDVDAVLNDVLGNYEFRS